MAGNIITLPFPENWETYVRRIKQAKVSFVKKADGRSNAAGSKQQIVKQLLLSKKSLDSLGWVITIP
jgi:hypothetical protein